MRSLVVTAADEKYAHLLRDLIASLQQWQPRPFTALAVFDLGLAPATRQWVMAQAEHVLEPGWDLPVDEPLRAAKPALRALTVRPFLPRYFPGYDSYLWLDADTWVQRADTFPVYLESAAAGHLAAAVSVDRAYRASPAVLRWRTSRLDACFGAGSGHRALHDRYFNAGAFALAPSAPHWAAWQRCFEQGLRATGGRLVCDQSALNQAVWSEDLPVVPLPAWLNWQCHLCAPRFDSSRGLWIEPHPPAEVLGLLHLTTRTKHTGVADPQPGMARSLRYGGGVAPSA